MKIPYDTSRWTCGNWMAMMQREMHISGLWLFAWISSIPAGIIICLIALLTHLYPIAWLALLLYLSTFAGFFRSCFLSGLYQSGYAKSWSSSRP